MYKIRSAQGTETVYDSLEEFSVAVKRGAVTPDDEIFHTRAGRWLDIKSHPHYRSALTWNGSESSASVGAGVASQPAKPGSPQTSLRPQLQAAPTPAPATNGHSSAYVPPQKTKELTFIDIDGAVVPPGTQRSATIVGTPRPMPKLAPRPTPAPAAKPEAKPSAPESDFLVMDGGIESPVRTSSGHRTVSDDLDVLFDAPLPEVPAPQVVPKASPSPKISEPPKQTAPSMPAAPKPAAPPAPAPMVAPKKEEKPAPAPAVSASPLTPAPVAPPAPKPVTTGARPALAVEEDLDIPGGPLTADVVSESQMPVQAPVHSRPKLSLIAGGIAAVGAVIVLLLWHPWQGSAAATDAAAQTAPGDSGTATTTSGATLPAGASGQNPTSAPVAPGIKPITTIGPAAAALIDSGTEDAGEEIIAAARPNFRADAVISTADIGLSNNDRTAAPAAVAPSDLARRAETAERAAQQELAVRLSAAGFRTVLSPSRIGSAEGAASARNAWISGSDAIRQYRARIGRIEKAYGDSMLASQRAERWSTKELRAWGARQSFAEAGDVSQLADLMFSQITEALDLLAALNGQYEIKNGLITFRSPGAESRYTSIRNWVEQRMQNWAATPETARPHSVTLILGALGDGLPAVK